jgi:glutamate N-acetyltransferase/amino-acid N-acetyltransferase
MIDGVAVTINGIAKGSGMIAPDLGTMLAFIFTDAAIPAEVLQTLLIVEVRETFNAITVDSDTSTSDTVLLFATGRGARHAPITRPGEARLRDFRQKLAEVMRDLAQLIVKDGEGATKFVTVRVGGAATARAARVIAMAVAKSPLVKTAIAGEEPHWGRIVMAVGKSGELADRDKLAIRFGEYSVARDGAGDPDYDEALVAAYMKQSEIAIDIDVGVGNSAATVWTCDLTHRYIDINADYRS